MSETRPNASPHPTEIAGRYEVVQKLGAGAFGTVYKARDRTLGRMLAIKTIRLEGLAAASTDLGELLKRFKQEATAGAALKHPNIVTVYDFGQSGGLTYLAMEYVEGQGLERIIAESGKLSVARAAGLAAQVADALGYAHQHNVIHRDIKPANIMVEAGERVKVTDFGIARVTNSGENLTQTGGLLGTPSYMSPEQARGQKVDGRSDLFSVGCVLYELLTGRKAFAGDTITGILFKIIAEEPAPIRELDPLIPEKAVAVVEKALAKSPEARYQTGRELADDLLVLTQPGHVPTMRQTDVSTAPVAAGRATTIATPPTAQGSSSTAPTPTAAQGPSPTRGATVPVPPTELVPPPPPPAAPAPTLPPPATDARTRRPQALPAHPKPGRGRGRWLALGAAAILILAVLATGTWMALGRRDPEPTPADASAEAPPPTAMSPRAAAAPTGAEGVEATSAEPTPLAPPPVARPPVASSAPAADTGAASEVPPRPAPGPEARSTERPVAEPRPAPAGSTATAVAPPAPPAGEDFLDQLPEEAPDGRAAGDALAQQYRSGSDSAGTFGATGRYRRRPRIPPHTPAEQPAVRALAWILSAQKAHLGRTGRYGTLGELVEAGDLPLGGGWTSDGFTRRQYRFTVTAAGDRFRADAQPLAPQGRAFYVDDAGYVLVAD